MLRRLTQRGETIVEVLIVTAALSAVMGVAFASTSRTLNASRQSQERSEGSAVAQTQIERLKTVIGTGDASPYQKFCLDNNNQFIEITSPVVPNPNINQEDFTKYPAACTSGPDGRFRTLFTYDSSNTKLYTAYVRWPSASGQGNENIEMLYRPSYVAPAVAIVPIVPTPPVTDPCPVDPANAATYPTNIFTSCYYNGINFNNFALTRQEGNSSGFTMSVGSASPAPGFVDRDNFSAKWFGKVNFDARNYTFTIRSDDGVRVYVDNELILDRFFEQSPTTYNIQKDFATAGLKTIRYEFYENGGDAVASISWAPQDQLPRTGLVWVDLAVANLTDGNANARTASGKSFCWNIYEQASYQNSAVDDGWMIEGSVPASPRQANYLCSDQNLGITWKQDGAIPGQFCYPWSVPGDAVHTWSDNYLCSTQPLGLQFNQDGAIPGKSCIAITEPRDDKPAIWGASGTARLCENATLPAESVLEGESFDAAGCRTPAGQAGASGNAVLQYCTVSTGTLVTTTADFSTLVFRARADHYQGWPRATIQIDGQTVFNGEVNSTSLRDFYVTGLAIPAGSHTFTVSFDNDACGCNGPYTDRNMFFDKLDLYRDRVVGEFEAETMTGTANVVSEPRGGASAGNLKKFYSAGTASRTVETTRIRTINIRALADQWLGAPNMTLRVDGVAVRTWSVAANDYFKYSVSGLNISPGTHTFEITFDNDACGGPDTTANPCGAQGNQDRNLLVDKIEFTEAEVLYDGNVAFGKSSVVSPVGYAYQYGNSTSITDGSDSTVFYPGGYGYAATTDLGAQFNLSRIIAVWNSYGFDNPNVYITNYNIEYSSDGSSWSSARSGGVPNENVTTAAGSYPNVRFIRVTATSSTNWIGLYEVKAYQ